MTEQISPLPHPPSLEEIIAIRKKEAEMYTLAQKKSEQLQKGTPEGEKLAMLLFLLAHPRELLDSIMTELRFLKHKHIQIPTILSSIHKTICTWLPPKNISDTQIARVQSKIQKAKNLSLLDPEQYLGLEKNQKKIEIFPDLFKNTQKARLISESRGNTDPEKIVYEIYQQCIEVINSPNLPEEIMSKIRMAVAEIFQKFETYHHWYAEEIQIDGIRRVDYFKKEITSKDIKEVFYQVYKLIDFFQTARSLRVEVPETKKEIANILNQIDITDDQNHPDLPLLLSFIRASYLEQE